MSMLAAVGPPDLSLNAEAAALGISRAAARAEEN